MIKNIILTAILFFLFIKINSQALSSQSQAAPDYFSPSPNAASLGTYGLIPINLSTGSPNINIDLLKFSTRGKDYNISLTYNLSSVKPEVPVQWTGLGWNLNVGGAITRNVNVMVDEARGPVPNTYPRKNYYHNYSSFDNSNWYNLENGVDAPDTFLFEINGINGKFYKNHQGKWVVSANEDVSFSITDEIKSDYFTYQYYNTTYPDKERCIYGFEIRDKYGNAYTFGKNDNALEIYDNSYNSFDDKEVSPTSSVFYTGKFVKSWYLTKIKYANGVVINFEYESDNNTTLIQHFSINYGFNKCIGSNTLNCGLFATYEKTFPKYLKKITFEEGSIEFNRSLANTLKYDVSYPFSSYLNDYNNSLHSYKLNSIVLFDKSNTIVDKVDFSYTESTNSRLKLNNLKIGKNLQSQKNYTFSYNQQTMPALAFQKNNVDHWGFYNGKNAVVNPSNMDNYYNLREPDSIAVKAETLERIDYPTGGYNIIEYEPNFYSKYVKYENNQISIVNNNIDKLTGGLRVKRIKTYNSSNSLPTIKKYYYVRDYFNNQNISSGVLSGIPNYIQEDDFYTNATQYHFKNLTSTSYVPLSDTKGYHIGYSKVYEKNENGSITEYSYSNYDNGYNDIIPSYPSKKYNTTRSYGNITTPSGSTNYTQSNTLPFSVNENIMQNSLSQERGLLLAKKEYNDSNALLAETLIQYNQNSNRLTDLIRNYSLNFLRKVEGPPMGGAGYVESIYTKLIPYIVYSNAVQKIGEKTINYYTSGNVATETNYTFSTNFNNNIKKIVTKTSDGTLFEKRLFYAEDLNIANDPQQYPVPYSFVYYMLAKNMMGVPLVTTNYKNNLFINRKQTIYQYFPEYTVNNDYIIHPKQELSYVKEENLPNMGALTIPNVTSGEKEITYDQYDNKSNLLQYTTNEGIPVTIIWGYNNTQPIAKIVGALYNNIKDNAKIISIINASNNDASSPSNEGALIASLDSLRANDTFKDYQITTYTYDPLIGVTSITQPSGIREVYVYDSNKRLKEIRENNASGNILKEYNYNYTPRKFYSKAIVNKAFTKNNCPTGMISSSVTYSVPAFKYESIIDQADADQQAENEGQNYANANLTCYYPYCTLNTQSSANYIMMQYAPFEKVNTTVNAQLHFQVTSSQGLDWSNQVILGNLESLCWPSSTITRSSGNWQITIYPASGQTTLRWIGSGGPTVGGYYSVNFSYNLN